MLHKSCYFIKGFFLHGVGGHAAIIGGVAIDNMISRNGQYRILVGPREGGKPWPDALRVGSGAQGIALLNNVPLWYEIWRKLNGFPPDYYTEEKVELPKLKAPVKSIK